jgi:cytochrome c oxidase subunit 3
MEARAHQFEDAEQQQEAATLGMWLFLATEVLLFGALLMAYAMYRGQYPTVFAEASRHLNVYLGTFNTAVLLCSSLAMAFAVNEAQQGRNRYVAGYLGVTLVLGMVFLAVKFYEYYSKYEEGLIPGATFSWSGDETTHASLFFLFYFILTGLHALHMMIGLGMLSVFLVGARRNRFSADRHTAINLGGLYWHFVDIVWVFLFPLLYLVDRTS